MDESLTITLGGNASVLLVAGKTRVMIDPWLGKRIGPWRRLRPSRFDSARLHGLSVLLITHAHPDHLDRAELPWMDLGTPVLSPGGTPHRILRRIGFPSTPLQEWEAWTAPAGELTVTAVPAYHVRWSLGYVVELAGLRIYHAGDANPRTPFAEIGRRCGPIDVALMPVGGSSLAPGPLQRHLTPELAARATAAVRPRLTIPIHWGHVPCVPAAIDRFRGTPEQFVAALARVAPNVEPLLPGEGVPLRIPSHDRSGRGGETSPPGTTSCCDSSVNSQLCNGYRKSEDSPDTWVTMIRQSVRAPTRCT